MRYVITDYDDAERARLSDLAKHVDPYTFYHLDRIGIAPDWICLEVGAGLGTVSLWLADRLTAGGEVVCTDLQTTFIDEIDHPRIRAEKLDILDEPAYENRFDLVVQRAIHHHVPDREAACRHLVKMVKPGGHILSIEPDIHPAFSDEHPVWRRTWEAVTQWGERKDIDYFTGRRLPGQLADMGLEVLSVHGETALLRGGAAPSPAVDLYRATLEIVVPEAMRKGFLSKADGEEVMDLLDRPDIWLMAFCFFATHARKPE